MLFDTIVIDGNYLLHRVTYSCGVPEHIDNSLTGCTGVITQVRDLLNRFTPSRCVYVWDGGHSSRRKEIYPAYKVKDSDDPEFIQHMNFFRNQQEKLKDILPLLNVKSVRVKGKEGDDVCAFISKYVKGKTLVVSDDKDYFLLVSKTVSIFRPMKDELITYGDCFKESIGCTERDYLFLKTVCGDSSDKIPGVNGVGIKTCLKLISDIRAVRSTGDIFDILFSGTISRDGLSKRECKVLDSKKVVFRNRDLMDLHMENFDEVDGLEILSKVLNPMTSYSPKKLFEVFSKSKFMTGMKSLTGWARPFTILS